MSATPQDVQAKLDAAVAALKLTTVGYKNKYWKAPPAGSPWAAGLADIQAARDEAGLLVAPSPPPSPAPSGAIDDKRTLNCISISSTGWQWNNTGPSQSINPPGMFTAQSYTNNDITIQSDDRYGKIWRVVCGTVSHNPYGTTSPATPTDWRYPNHNSMLSWHRGVTTDAGAASWDWYAFAVKHDAGWDPATFPDWGLLFEVGYAHNLSPSIACGWIGTTWTIQNQAGYQPNPPHYPFPVVNHYPVRPYSDMAGKWMEGLFGVYWSSRNNGRIIMKTRIPENGETTFRTDVDVSNALTWNWGGYPGVPQDAINWGTDDLWGSYEGWNGGVRYNSALANFPVRNLSLYGWVRCPTEASARSYLPA